MARTKILIVEDEKIVALDIKNTLLHLGYAVCGIALSGEEVLKQIKETQPALVLMDIVLKGDMDGIEAAEHVRHRSNIPVIYLTAYADQKTWERAKITEPFGYIIKPFEEKELYTAIEMALYKHRMESKLKKSEEKYHRLIDRLTDIVFTLDKDGNFTYLSPQFEKLTGHPTGNLLGHSFTKNIAPEYIKSTVEYFKRGLLSKKIPLYEIELLCKDGKRLPIELNVTSILNAEGKIIGTLGVARDITERKQAGEIVKKHIEMEKTLTEISAIVVKAKQMGVAAKKALVHLGTVFDVDHVHLFQIRKKEKIWDHSYEWIRKGLKVKKRSRRGISFDNFSQWIKQLKHHQVIAVPDVKKLSSRLQKNIKKISEQDIKSFLIISLYFEENFFGALGLFNNSETRTWRQDDIGILQAAGEIITSGLVKDRFQKKLTQVLEELEADRMKMVELAKRIIDAQEKERLYLASEIHDDMLQGLVAILYFLQMIDISTLDRKMQERKEQLIELIKASIDRGRRLISEIEPIREPEIGLIQAVKKSIDLRFAGLGTKVEFNYPGKFPKINFAAKINILRIIQEALMNVRKHAQATRVSIKISVFKNKLKMEIKDNGVGFNPKLILKKNTRHYGILTMQERAQLIDGTLFVTSKPGKRTIVKGFFPLDRKPRTSF